MNLQLDKRQRQFDKVIDEWKLRVGEVQAAFEKAQKESRGNAAEGMRLRGQLEETLEVIEVLKKENKNLSGMQVFFWHPNCSSGLRVRIFGQPKRSNGPEQCSDHCWVPSFCM